MLKRWIVFVRELFVDRELEQLHETNKRLIKWLNELGEEVQS